MTAPVSRLLSPARIGALILLVFAAGAVPGAVIELLSGTGNTDWNAMHVAAIAVPILIALAVAIVLRHQREIRGALILQIIVAAALGVTTAGSVPPLSWYLGAGLVLWAMRLGRNELMWVGTGLLVLCIGVQFGMLPGSGAVYIGTAGLGPLVLIGAAVYSWRALRNDGDDVSDISADDELHRSRYGKLPGQ